MLTKTDHRTLIKCGRLESPQQCDQKCWFEGRGGCGALGPNRWHPFHRSKCWYYLKRASTGEKTVGCGQLGCFDAALRRDDIEAVCAGRQVAAAR